METLVIRGDMIRQSEGEKASIFDTEGKKRVLPGIKFDGEGNLLKRSVIGDRDTITSVLAAKKRATVIKFDKRDIQTLRALRNSSIMKQHQLGLQATKKPILI